MVRVLWCQSPRRSCTGTTTTTPTTTRTRMATWRRRPAPRTPLPTLLPPRLLPLPLPRRSCRLRLLPRRPRFRLRLLRPLLLLPLPCLSLPFESRSAFWLYKILRFGCSVGWVVCAIRQCFDMVEGLNKVLKRQVVEWKEVFSNACLTSNSAIAMKATIPKNNRINRWINNAKRSGRAERAQPGEMGGVKKPSHEAC